MKLVRQIAKRCITRPSMLCYVACGGVIKSAEAYLTVYNVRQLQRQQDAGRVGRDEEVMGSAWQAATEQMSELQGKLEAAVMLQEVRKRESFRTTSGGNLNLQRCFAAEHSSMGLCNLVSVEFGC